MSDKIVERVGALLAKAESTDSPHEAEALVAKAQQLATVHAVDLALARQRARGGRRREEPTQRRLTIGPARRQGNRHLAMLAIAVASANDVVCDIATNATYVLAHGFPSDLDVLETMYAALATQMVAAANAAVARGEHRGEVYRSPSTGELRSDARVFRTAFYGAYVRTIAERLQDARQEAVDSMPDGGQPSGALVLARKEEEVRGFHARASTARGTWRGSRAPVTARSPAGERQGRAAGRRARLRGDDGLPGVRGEVGR